uniref:OTU domain-containing protein n=1 Tax=Trypanosoma congolense (strain IL3000) TaxID=1068625 RepID=G0UMI3_TRYCI|nr:conserved hypothetical protein [Trypanosoma congolense IL3000]
MTRLTDLIAEKFIRDSATRDVLFLSRNSLGRGSANPAGNASGASTPTTYSGSHGMKSPDPRRCWLCSARIKHITSDDVQLCFTCLRVAFQEIIMPLINQPQRQKTSAAFISKIAQVESIEASGTSLPRLPGVVASPLTSMTDAVPVGGSAPQQTPQPPGSTNLDPANDARRVSTRDSLPPNGASVDPRGFDDVPKELRHIRGCTTSEEPGIRCPVCYEICNAEDNRLSRCHAAKTLHLVWVCLACENINTQNVDRCYHCSASLMWTCLHCSVTQKSLCTEEGLRECSNCHSISTPIDVLRSLKLTTKPGTEARANAGSSAECNIMGTGGDVGVAVEFGVNDPDTLAEKARQEEIEAGRIRLDRRIRQLGVGRVNEQLSDGNCLFRAIATQLLGEPDAHMTIRRLVVGYMKSCAENYKFLFDGDDEWHTYLSNMCCSGFWGDELCLNAASRCFHVNIHVITSAEVRWHLVFRYDELKDSTTTSYGGPDAHTLPGGPESINLFLVYIAPVHYNDITVFPSEIIPLNACITEKLESMMNTERKHQLGGNVAGMSGSRTDELWPGWYSSEGHGDQLQRTYSERPPSRHSELGHASLHGDQLQRTYSERPPSRHSELGHASLHGDQLQRTYNERPPSRHSELGRASLHGDQLQRTYNERPPSRHSELGHASLHGDQLQRTYNERPPSRHSELGHASLHGDQLQRTYNERPPSRHSELGRASLHGDQLQRTYSERPPSRHSELDQVLQRLEEQLWLKRSGYCDKSCSDSALGDHEGWLVLNCNGYNIFKRDTEARSAQTRWKQQSSKGDDQRPWMPDRGPSKPRIQATQAERSSRCLSRDLPSYLSTRPQPAALPPDTARSTCSVAPPKSSQRLRPATFSGRLQQQDSAPGSVPQLRIQGSRATHNILPFADIRNKRIYKGS